MPLYEYECDRCQHTFEHRIAVGLRNTVLVCRACAEGLAKRKFTPTANIITPEHFRHLQSEFLPQAGDTAAWEHRAKDSQYHVGGKRDDGKEFEEFVRRDMARQGASL